MKKILITGANGQLGRALDLEYQGKGSADFAKVLGQMGDAAGMTQTAYEKMLTPTERMNISFNKIKNSLIQFGAALTPAFDKVAGIIGKVGDKLNNLSEGQVNAIVKFAAIAAAILPCLASCMKRSPVRPSR